jgi:2'-5' RNA ligase
MDNLRIFIGIDLPGAIAERLSARMAHMQTILPFRKWTHPSDLHLTLHFLGQTPAGRLDAVRDAMARAAAKVHPFQITFAGIGTFGSPRAPRVVWLGLSEPTAFASLFRLHAELAAHLSAAGFELDARPYRPHLTLARPSGAEYAADMIQTVWAESGAKDPGIDVPLSWTVDRITLFQTWPGRRPSYERRYECALIPI